MKVFLNGRIVDERQAFLSVFDHGFLYGDGVYETVFAKGYRLFDWPAHARRLRAALKETHLSAHWTSVELERIAIRVLRANKQPEGSVRLTFSRGAGPLGLDPALCKSPTIAVMVHPSRARDELKTLGTSAAISTVIHESSVSHLKSTNVLSAVLAKAEAGQWGAFDAIRVNARGQVTEGTTSNVFWIRGGQLYTPALACGLLDGITRQQVLGLARAFRLRVREGIYRSSDLLKADELFLTNSTFGLLPVVHVMTSKARRYRIADGRPGPLTQTFQLLFDERFRS